MTGDRFTGENLETERPGLREPKAATGGFQENGLVAAEGPGLQGSPRPRPSGRVLRGRKRAPSGSAGLRWIAPVRTAPFTIQDLVREAEVFAVWGMSKDKGTMTFSIFSRRGPDLVEAIAANNPLLNGRPRSIRHYNTERYGETWCTAFPTREIAWIALLATKFACEVCRPAFVKVAALMDLNQRIKRLASPRSLARRLAAQAERDALLEDAVASIRLARKRCLVRKARKEAGLAVPPLEGLGKAACPQLQHESDLVTQPAVTAAMET
jgi:hypothetical protein